MHLISSWSLVQCWLASRAIHQQLSLLSSCNEAYTLQGIHQKPRFRDSIATLGWEVQFDLPPIFVYKFNSTPNISSLPSRSRTFFPFPPSPILKLSTLSVAIPVSRPNGSTYNLPPRLGNSGPPFTPLYPSVGTPRQSLQPAGFGNPGARLTQPYNGSSTSTERVRPGISPKEHGMNGFSPWVAGLLSGSRADPVPRPIPSFFSHGYRTFHSIRRRDIRVQQRSGLQHVRHRDYPGPVHSFRRSRARSYQSSSSLHPHSSPHRSPPRRRPSHAHAIACPQLPRQPVPSPPIPYHPSRDPRRRDIL